MRSLIEVLGGKSREQARKPVVLGDGTLSRPIVEFDPKGLRRDNVFDFGDSSVGFILKPAEGKQKELILRACARFLTEGHIEESSFLQFVGNMVQLLGGIHETCTKHIKSNQLKVGNDTLVTFYRDVKHIDASIKVTSQGTSETIDYDDFGDIFVVHSSVPFSQTFYSPVSEKQEPFTFGNVGDQKQMHPYRIANREEMASVLQRTFNAFKETQKGE